MGSRNKEATIVGVDVGQSMKNYQEYASQTISNLAVSQVLHKPSWFLSIIAFGTSSTNNLTYDEMVNAGIEDQYRNINVLKELSSPSMDHILAAKAIAQEESATGCSDFVEMLTVACSILKKENLDSKIVKKIVLISNFATQIAEVGDEFLSVVKEQLQQMEVWLEIVCLDEDAMENEFKQRNLEVLNGIREDMKHSSFTRVPSPVELLGAFRAKSVAPVSTYRGNFTVSECFQIPVRIYKKTSAETMPYLKQHVPGVESIVRNTEHFIKRQQDEEQEGQLQVEDNLSSAVPAEERVRAYQYGKQYVPLDPDIEKELSYSPDKGVTLIGFTERDKVPRHHFIKECSVLLPEAEEMHCQAMSSLVRAMKECDKVAIIKVVSRANGTLQMMVGIPYISAGNYKRDCLLLNQIAFAEDLRNYSFTSFQNLQKYHPTKQQVVAMEKIIDSMDLDDQLNFEQISDPTIQRFHRLLGEKALDQNAVVPESDDLMDYVFDQNFSRFPSAQQALENLPELFELQKQQFTLPESNTR